MSELAFREGRASDLNAVFALGEEARGASRRTRGAVAPEIESRDAELHEEWERERPIVKFLAGQPGGAFWVAEDGDALCGYLLAAHFGAVDALVELWVAPSHGDRGWSARCSSAPGRGRPRRRSAGWWWRRGSRPTSRSSPSSA